MTTKLSDQLAANLTQQPLDWVQIASDQVIVATDERVWVYRPSATDSSEDFTSMPNRVSSPATTRKLLDTAIVLAKRAVGALPPSPAMTPTRWAWCLVGQYHLNHVTPTLMKEAAQRFAAAGRTSLAQWATRKAAEESGHDRLALLDLQSLGYDAQAVVSNLTPKSAALLVDYFTRSVETHNPIACMGFGYVMERLALITKEKDILALEATLPPGTNATRNLRVHSSIGDDAEHIEETVEMVARLTALERTQVATACYETALLYFDSLGKGDPSDEELGQLLNPYQQNETWLNLVASQSLASVGI